MGDYLPHLSSPTGGSGFMGAPGGTAQGHIGSVFGQANGAQEGMNRFESGGMEPNPILDAIKALFPDGEMPTVGGDMGRSISPVARAAGGPSKVHEGGVPPPGGTKVPW